MGSPNNGSLEHSFNMSTNTCEDLLSAPTTGSKARASSVLQKNSKLYGPMNALDLEDSSNCWNSEGDEHGDSIQWISIEFGRSVFPSRLDIQFQAGFSAETAVIDRRIDEEWKEVSDIEPEDAHELQSFALFSEDTYATTALRIRFSDFTDFYNRVTIYKLAVWGQESRDEE